MTRNEGFIWSEKAIRELQQWRNRVPALIDQAVAQAIRNYSSVSAKDVRAGITVGYDPISEIESSALYPDRPANTFWVKLGRPVYAEAVGQQSLSVVPYDPPQYRLAHDFTNQYIEDSTKVWITLQHGQYFFIPTSDVIFGFKLVEDMGEGVALAEIYKLNGEVFGDQVGEDPYNLYDPSGWAIGLLEEDKGLCNLQDGKYYAIQAPCPKGI